MGWLVAFAVLAALAVMPLGISARYTSSGAQAYLILGPVQVALYPGKKKKSPKKDRKKTESSPKKQTEKAEEQGGSLPDFIPLVRAILDFLVDFRRKIRVNLLQLQLTMAGGDPCDLAINYGKTWAALEGILPQLNRFFVIKERKIDVVCDFMADNTTVFARLDITITLCRLLGIALRHGARVVREFTRIVKFRKGGALQ